MRVEPKALDGYAFLDHSLDRVSEARCDEQALVRLRSHPQARLLVISDAGQVPVGPNQESLRWYRPESAEAAPNFLGCWEDQPIFCVPADARTDPRLSEGTWIDLRTAAACLPTPQAGLLAYARALLHWQRRKRFCGVCGAPVALTHAGHRGVCSAEHCAAEYFPRTDPAIIVLVHDGERCLLGRQAQWPERRFSTLAGFVEPGETLEQALQREVCEETGVRVARCQYLASQPWPFPASLMLAFEAYAPAQPIRTGAELSEARWFTPTELRALHEQGALRLPPRISVSHHLIVHWYQNATGLQWSG